MIRDAKPEDAREISAFYTDIRTDTVPSIHNLEEVTDYIGSVLIARGSSFVWVEDGVIVGWLDLHEGWVDQLYCRRAVQWARHRQTTAGLREAAISLWAATLHFPGERRREKVLCARGVCRSRTRGRERK